MPKRIFVAATGQHCGKTTSSLLFMRAAQSMFGRVGFMKPVGQEYREVDGRKIDKDALLMADVFGLSEHLEHMSPIVSDRNFTRRCIDGEITPDELVARLTASFAVLADAFDAVVIEGTGHSGVGSVFGLSNARVASLLDAPVTIVTGGGIGQVVDHVELALPLYAQEKATVRAVMANKIIADKRDQSLTYLKQALGRRSLEVVGGLNYSPRLANPALRSIARHLGVEIQGNGGEQDRLINTIQMGVASSQRVVDLLEPDTLLITASTRDELLVTIASLYDIPEYRARIVAVVITGNVPISPITHRILKASGLAILRTETNATTVFIRLRDYVAKLRGEDKAKLAWIFDCGDEQVSSAQLARLFSSD